MYSMDGQNIYINRGDSGRFKLTLTNSDSTTYTPAATDTIVFTAYNGNRTLFSTHIYPADSYMTLQPKHTNNLAYGTYTYTVTVTQSGGSTFTVSSGYKFIVESEVTF